MPERKQDVYVLPDPDDPTLFYVYSDLHSDVILGVEGIVNCKWDGETMRDIIRIDLRYDSQEIIAELKSLAKEN